MTQLTRHRLDRITRQLNQLVSKAASARGVTLPPGAPREIFGVKLRPGKRPPQTFEHHKLVSPLGAMLERLEFYNVN